MRMSDWSSDVCSSDLRDLPTDEQIAVHIQDIALNLFVSDVTKEDAVNNSIPAASSTNGSIAPNVVDGMQALRTGLGLMRASQLTMVRFQLAIYHSKRRTELQALRSEKRRVGKECVS